VRGFSTPLLACSPLDVEISALAAKAAPGACNKRERLRLRLAMTEAQRAAAEAERAALSRQLRDLRERLPWWARLWLGRGRFRRQNRPRLGAVALERRLVYAQHQREKALRERAALSRRVVWAWRTASRSAP
jgi:hypothetical protein